MITKKHYPLIRTIYLYLFALVGLVLLVIGTVRFVDMGLKAFVFTKAEEPEKIRQEYKHYSVVPIPLERIEKYQEEEELTLTETEKAQLNQWFEDYQRWQETEAKINYLTVQRHRNASQNLAFILIGLPLYLFHWRMIKRETKDKEEK